MLRLSLLGLLAVSTAVLAGCPVYDDNGPQGCTYDCGGTTTTTTTNPGGCSSQADCKEPNQTCGSDNVCHTGDCTFWQCAKPQVCAVGPDQKAHCEDPSTATGGTGGSSGASTGGASTGGASSGGSGGASTGGASSGGSGGASTGGASSGGSGGASTSGSGGSGGASTSGSGGSGGSGGASSSGSGGSGGASSSGSGGQMFKCPGGAALGGMRLSTEACAADGTDDLSMCCNANLGLTCVVDAAGSTCQ